MVTNLDFQCGTSNLQIMHAIQRHPLQDVEDTLSGHSLEFILALGQEVPCESERIHAEPTASVCDRVRVGASWYQVHVLERHDDVVRWLSRGIFRIVADGGYHKVDEGEEGLRYTKF